MNFQKVAVILLILITGMTVIERMNAADTTKEVNIIVNLLIGSPSGTGSKEFFNEYLSTFDISVNQFAVSPLISATAKMNAMEEWNFGIKADYFSAWANNSYSENEFVSGTYVTRAIDHKISLNTIPFTFIAEYVPVQLPYHSYIGAGAGLSFGTMTWFENINSSYSNDIRQTGTRFDENLIAPCLSIYSGVELKFDKKQNQELLGGVLLEVSYNYVFRQAKVFTGFKKQFVNPPASWDNSFRILPGYLGLMIGISFNLIFGR